MAHTIRPFTNDDYGALSALGTIVWQFEISVDELQEDDGKQTPPYKAARWVAEVDGKVIGAAEYYQLATRYHPQRFSVAVIVHPEYRGRGVGRALWQTLCDALSPLNPVSLTVNTREDFLDGMGFAQRRGFTPKMTTWEQALNLPTWDGAAFQHYVDHAVEQGYQLRPLSALADRPNWQHELHALIQELRRDVPSADPITEQPFDEWVEKALGSKAFFADGWVIALKDGKMVGMTATWYALAEDDLLLTGLTAVQREHRGKKLSYALKVAAMQAMKARGYREVLTWNEANNQAMLVVNARLGFEKRPAWVDLIKEF